MCFGSFHFLNLYDLIDMKKWPERKLIIFFTEVVKLQSYTINVAFDTTILRKTLKSRIEFSRCFIMSI